MGRQPYAMFRFPVSVEDAPARKTPFLRPVDGDSVRCVQSAAMRVQAAQTEQSDLPVQVPFDLLA